MRLMPIAVTTLLAAVEEELAVGARRHLHAVDALDAAEHALEGRDARHAHEADDRDLRLDGAVARRSRGPRSVGRGLGLGCGGFRGGFGGGRGGPGGGPGGGAGGRGAAGRPQNKDDKKE